MPRKGWGVGLCMQLGEGGQGARVPNAVHAVGSMLSCLHSERLSICGPIFMQPLGLQPTQLGLLVAQKLNRCDLDHEHNNASIIGSMKVEQMLFAVQIQNEKISCPLVLLPIFGERF